MIRFLALLAVAFAAFAFMGGFGDGSAIRAILGEEARALSIDVQELGALAIFVALLLLLLPALFGGYRGRAGSAIRDLMSWTMLGAILVAGYSYRDELGRIAYRLADELAPPGSPLAGEQRQAGERAVRIRKRGDGHFVARVAVEGASVNMLVDTGASTVVLRQSDATELGVDTRRLRYTVPVQTANGLAYAAHARLKSGFGRHDRAVTGGCSRGPARCVEREPPRYEFFKPSQVL